MNYREIIRVLLDDIERPAWIKKYDPTMAELIRLRYIKRTASRNERRVVTNYDKYLETLHWQRLRVAVMMLAGGQCVKCGKTADDVHHLRYSDERGNCVWFRERLRDLEPLCRGCHCKEHSIGELNTTSALPFSIRKEIKNERASTALTAARRTPQHGHHVPERSTRAGTEPASLDARKRA